MPSDSLKALAEGTRRPFSGYPAALAALCPFGPYRGRVMQVTDGDSAWVLVNPGFRGILEVSVRFSRFNAPEVTSGPAIERLSGARARDTLIALLPADGFVVLQTETDLQTQSFERWIGDLSAVVSLENGGKGILPITAAMRFAQRVTNNWGLGFPLERNWYGNSPSDQAIVPDAHLPDMQQQRIRSVLLHLGQVQ